MAMTVKRVSDTAQSNVFLTKVADVPGGISVKASNLIDGGVIPQGTVVSAPSSGVCAVIKTAKYVAGGSTTAIRVEKNHHFEVADVVCAKESGKAYAITVINTSNASYDVITVGTAIDDPGSNDGYIYEAAAEVGSGSALVAEPYAVIGTAEEVVADDNIITDAWVIATVKSGYIAPALVPYLKGIVEI